MDFPIVQKVMRMPAVWRLRLLQRLAQWGVREETLLIVLSVVIGLGGGAAAWVFKWLVDFVMRVAYEWPALRWDATVYLFLLPLLPAVGGLLMSCVRWAFRTEKSPFHGLTNVLLSLIRTGGKLPHKTGLETLLCSSLTIGSGGSAGPEAPIAIIGSSLGSSMGAMLGISRRYLPTLVGCGAAAGIGAVFDAPIAGVLFALEVMLRDFSVKTFTPIVVSAVIGTTTFHSLSRVAAGQATRGIFEMPPGNGAFVFTFHELPNYVLLGIFCGLLAIAFTYAMHGVEKGAEWIKRVPRFFKPAIGAGLSGVCGIALIWIFRHDSLVHHRFMENAYVPIFGGGYPTILRAIDPTWYAANGHVVDGHAAALGLEFLLVACVLKVVATSFTLGSGGSGGVFAPALFIGACGGGAFGLVLSWIEPQAAPNAYALVGMGAVLAAVIQAPLMSILLLFEITRNYDVMLPIMLTAVTATVIYQLVFGESIYTQPLRARGIRVGSAAGISMLRRVTVDQLKLEPVRSVQAGQLVGELLKVRENVTAGDYVVVDDKGKYLGILAMSDLQSVLLSPEAAPLVLVGEVCQSNVPPVLATDTLEAAIDLFSRHEVNCLAVIRRTAGEAIVGMLTRSDAMREYHAALG